MQKILNAWKQAAQCTRKRHCQIKYSAGPDFANKHTKNPYKEEGPKNKPTRIHRRNKIGRREHDFRDQLIKRTPNPYALKKKAYRDVERRRKPICGKLLIRGKISSARNKLNIRKIAEETKN